MKVTRWLTVVAWLLGTACAVPAPLGSDVGGRSGAPTTIVSLTFDDTFADQFQVGALVAARGMHATFFVNSGRVNLAGSMSQGQLLSLQQQGNEIAGHTVSHADLPTLDLDEERRQICNDRVALLGLGLQVASFAYPFGDANVATEQIVAACGYTSARGVGDLVSPPGCRGCAFANPVPPTDPFKAKTNDSIKIDTTLDMLELYVTQAEDNGGGWVPIVMHHVCDGCDPLSVSPATLAAFLDWLAARADAGTVVRTVHEVMGGPVLPGVPGPPPSVPATAGNLLQNPSLESDTNGDGVPECWQRGGSGTNTATYTLTGTAADGAVAQRIDVTSFSSGARRLVSRQDLGSCAPAVIAGHAYTMAAQYLATSPPRFTVYYRTSSGGWVYFTQSPTFPVTASYARATFTTPPLPAGATAISIGLSLYDVGSLTMDAYELRDADTTPPLITLTDPGDGATVSGLVTLGATATDAGGVDHVDFLIDGALVATTRGTFAAAWDSRGTADGVIGVTARAVDIAGNSALSTSRLVTVVNPPGADTTPPTIALTAPVEGATIVGVTTLTADATDDVGVVHGDFLVDGQLVGSSDTAPWAASWDATSAPPGPAQVTARAVDAAGNLTVSAPIDIVIPGSDPAAPTIAIACNGGACGAATSNQPIAITLTATAGGPSGVAQIRYTLDGSVPSATSGIVYAGPFALAATAAVRFVAISGAGVPSAVGMQLVALDTSPPAGVAITSPAPGAVVHGVTPIVAAASDDVGVVRVRFYLDGKQLGTRTAAPLKWNWDAATTTHGSHVLAIQAEDAAGNATRSANVSVVVN